MIFGWTVACRPYGRPYDATPVLPLRQLPSGRVDRRVHQRRSRMSQLPPALVPLLPFPTIPISGSSRNAERINISRRCGDDAQLPAVGEQFAATQRGRQQMSPPRRRQQQQQDRARAAEDSDRAASAVHCCYSSARFITPPPFKSTDRPTD